MTNEMRDELIRIIREGGLETHVGVAELTRLVKHSKGVREKAHKVANFRDIIQYADPDRLLARLHQLIDGRKGADVGCVLLRCITENYLLRRPTQREFESEFVRLGSWQGIHKYMDDNNLAALDRANKVVIFSR
jgi:hypothetical protein